MFGTADEAFILERIRSGEVVLFLGAGASHGSKTSRGSAIPKGKDLESIFRKTVGETAPDLDLGDLADDVRKQEGSHGFQRILEREFLDCTASNELERLFSYTWYRCYTLNYDDAIIKIPRHRRVQQFKGFPRNSNVEEQRDFTELQVVYLNGMISRPEDGYILSPREYRAELRKTSTWYKKCARDFVDRTFLFVGTELDEPVFQAHIEALQDGSLTSYSKSFLISPTTPSSRKTEKLNDFNIIFRNGTLATLCDWLQAKIAGGNNPESVIGQHGKFSIDSDSDIKIASVLRELGTADWIESKRLDPSHRMRFGRDFYSGIAPSWETIVNTIPARLEGVKDIGKFLAGRAQVQRGDIVIVRGQSGSGKATATMVGLLDLARSQSARIFEIDDCESDILVRAISYLGRQPGKKKLLYVPSIHLHIDLLERISAECERAGVDVVGQVRKSDWTGRFGRRKGFVGDSIEISKLTNPDYSLLASALDDFAIAPEFKKLDKAKKIELLKQSNRQLLIVMMEATKQRRFEETIESEYQSIDEDARAVFCIVALITMSRSRLSLGEIEDIVKEMGTRQTFSTILGHLDGMIEVTSGRLLVGRHDLFVRHIVEKTADHALLKDSIIAILNSFTIYKEPFVKNAGKVKGNILKFLMRSRFLQDIFGPTGNVTIEEIYEELEHAYQRDGHFWLQRGKFYQARGRHEDALKFLYRSVEAYDNEFARHSLAHQKLIYCSTFARPSIQLRDLLAEGVTELERQIDVRDDAEDEYPIVALSRLHPEVLFKWGDKEEARRQGANYFERLTIFERRLSYRDQSVQNAMAFCLHLATQGVLQDRNGTKKR